jgi:CheY-like chemotaxis protein
VVAWLPLRQPESAAGPRELLPVAIEPMERFALVVEDDARAADLLRLMLEAEGFSVLQARSGEAALDIVALHTPSLITLDLVLPGMDGMHLLTLIRDLPALATVPVVVIANVLDARAATAADAVVMLQKPITRAQLTTSLGVLGLHAAQEHTYTVLLVDDDPKALEVIAAFLPRPAYTLLRAIGGREAIELARLHRPELILLDLLMPEVDGFDVIDALQRDESTARIPILVVTAKRITAADRRTFDGHPDKTIRFIEKAGFNRRGFISEVRRALLAR